MCRCPVGRLQRDYGLGDFLANAVLEEDDAPTLAVRAILFFCEDVGERDTRFQVAVYAVMLFLCRHHAKPPVEPTSRLTTARDLAQLAFAGQHAALEVREQQLRRWVESNFG